MIESFKVKVIRKLLSVIDKESYTGFRDGLIIQFLLDTMVRVSELVTMKRGNIHLGFVKIEATETKTRRARLVPLLNINPVSIISFLLTYF